MRLALWVAVALGIFFAFSLFSFWLAVRPPRIHVALEPRELRLAPESVTITARDVVAAVVAIKNHHDRARHGLTYSVDLLEDLWADGATDQERDPGMGTRVHLLGVDGEDLA